MRSSAGLVAAFLLLAAPVFVLVQPLQSALAAMEDTMMEGDDKMVMKGDSMMMEDKPKYHAFRGQISNVQLAETGQPEWIQSGIWVLRMSQSDTAAEPSFSFISRIAMVRPDGTSSHTHTITRLAVSEYSIEGTTHTVQGTATIAMPDGPAAGVPVVIRIINDAVIAVWIGPEGVNGHFGDNPVYGTVSKLRASGGQMMDGGQMMEKPEKLTRTNVPVTIPLTRGFVDGNEVLYISTEASDRDLASHLTNLTGFRVAYSPALANTPASALANIYAFANGIAGPGPLGFQPNVADSQPGDPEYSPLWNVIMVEWQQAEPRELKSEEEILAALQAGEVTITRTELVVNCAFVEWEGGSLPVRQDKTLTDETGYGGGQVLEIDKENMTVTFVAHRGFAPDGSTIYYIATDASVKEMADALGVIHVNKTGSTLLTGASSDLWVFTNGISGTGPMGFQASIAGSNIGDAGYSPLWRIVAATWADADTAEFLTTARQISDAISGGKLGTEIAGVVVNCPFVQVA
jgi:hypothetical protein